MPFRLNGIFLKEFARKLKIPAGTIDFSLIFFHQDMTYLPLK